MSNRRKAIRTGAVSAISGHTDAGTRVYANRVLPLWEAQYPLILIYSRDESAEPISRFPTKNTRRLKLAIDIRVAIEDGIGMDDELDKISKQVESAIEDDPTLGGTALSCNYQDTEMDASVDGKQPIGAARLTYEVIYVD